MTCPVPSWWLRSWPALPRVRTWLPCSRSLRAPKLHLPDWPEVVTPHVLRHFCASQLPGRHDGHTSAVTRRGLNGGRRYTSRNGGRGVSELFGRRRPGGVGARELGRSVRLVGVGGSGKKGGADCRKPGSRRAESAILRTSKGDC